jgi:hypothetical protein
MKNKNATSETLPEVKRPVGRPSTYPAGTAVTAFPTRVTQDTVDRLREMKDARQSPFGLDHNSIGAELHRIVEQAHRKFTGDRERRAAKAASKAAPVVAENVETLEG